jgi:hypothetical protein
MFSRKESLFLARITFAHSREIVSRTGRGFPVGSINWTRQPRHASQVLDSVVTDWFVASKGQPPTRFSLSYHFDSPIVLEDVDVIRTELQRGYFVPSDLRRAGDWRLRGRRSVAHDARSLISQRVLMHSVKGVQHPSRPDVVQEIAPGRIPSLGWLFRPARGQWCVERLAV